MFISFGKMNSMEKIADAISRLMVQFIRGHKKNIMRMEILNNSTLKRVALYHNCTSKESLE